MTTIGSGQGLNRLFNGSTGMQVNRMLDQLGLPDQLGDLIGARIDAQSGDVAGMMRNLQGLNAGIPTAQLDNIFGKGLAPQGFVPRPFAALGTIGGALAGGVAGALAGGIGGAIVGGIGGALAGRLAGKVGDALANGLGGTGFGGALLGQGFNNFGGVNREAPFGTGLMGRSMEFQIQNNPFFKAQMERQLGGLIMADGRNDGALTIYRPPFAQLGGLMRSGFQSGLLPNLGMAGAIGGLGLPMAGAFLGNAVTGGLMRGLMRMEGNISSFMGGQYGVNDTTSTNLERLNMRFDPESQNLAQGMGIDIRNASFEDILFIMMMKYAQKKEKEILGKVKALDKSMKAADDSKGGGGILSGLGSLAGGLAGTALGGPIGGIAGNWVGGKLGSLIGGGGDELGVANSETIDGRKIGDMSETMKQQMLTKLMNDLSKMYEMLSNMIKSMHDMQMNPVRNLRG